MLKSGASGEDVERLQKRLAAAGFDPGKADGIFGAKTEAALKAFQESMGIAVDGIAGPQTNAKLAEAQAAAMRKLEEAQSATTDKLEDQGSGGPSPL